MAHYLKNDSPFARTEYDLTQWGIWSRDSGPLYKKTDKKGCTADISDDKALRIDAAVLKLGQKSFEMQLALHAFFRGQLRIFDVQSALRVSREAANALLNKAIAWIDAKLYDNTEDDCIEAFYISKKGAFERRCEIRIRALIKRRHFLSDDLRLELKQLERLTNQAFH